MRISDAALALLGIVACGFGITAFLKTRGPSTQIELKKELQLVGVVKELDCVTCIEKVMCYWEILEQDFSKQGLKLRLIFCRESNEFEAEELKYLCNPPKTLEIIDITEIQDTPSMPLSTPALYLSDGNHILFMQPIFLISEMPIVHEQINFALNQYLPKARYTPLLSQ